MKKVIIFILSLFLFIPTLFASNQELNIYLFYGDGCPHCAALERYMEPYLEEHKDIILHKYEVWHSEENLAKLKEVQGILKSSGGVPYLIIGNSAIIGFDEDITPERIRNSINYYKNTNYKDEVGIYLGVVEDTGSEEENNEKYSEEEYTIPIIGKKKATDAPLLLSAIIIGLVDGFNPCAMWILIFLISMLLGMKNKKRKWILGITFLFTSALVYFLFLISWLNLAQFLNNIIYIRLGIAMASIILGVVSLLRFLKNLQTDDGCDVVDTKNRKRIILSIQKIVKEKSFFLAILGIILLAASVNVIELMCSLGLPVMFSEILTLNNVSNTSKIIYSIIYVFFFLIDDIIVFSVAMKTLEIKVISNKFGKYSHLIGGLIMLAIGVLMLFKPEWIMFG